MKKISKILRYMGDYKGRIALYFSITLLSVIFSVLSLGMLSPILTVIFTPDETSTPAPAQWSLTNITQNATKLVQDSIAENQFSLTHVNENVITIAFTSSFFCRVPLTWISLDIKMILENH